MRIGLNAGHTLSGPGSGTSGVIVESIETRKVCNRLTEMFKACGVEVVPCTIDKAATQKAYLQKVVEMANRTDLDYFISIHFNNDKARKGHGVEAYTFQGRQYPDAVEVCEHIAALGFSNRGVKEGSGLYVIRKTKAKSMLIEVCFVNNPDATTYQQKFECFSQYGRGMPDLCHRYLMRSHGCAFYAGLPLVREHHDLCQLVIAVQPDVE